MINNIKAGDIADNNNITGQEQNDKVKTLKEMERRYNTSCGFGVGDIIKFKKGLSDISKDYDGAPFIIMEIVPRRKRNINSTPVGAPHLECSPAAIRAGFLDSYGEFTIIWVDENRMEKYYSAGGDNAAC